MQRYAMKIEYMGAPFSGWQRQAEHPSVQGAIETALSKLEPGCHTIAAAGRTDSGVHARAQVAHCDLSKNWDPFKLAAAMNYHLRPSPVAIVDCAKVDSTWHARFSAVERRYLYRINCRRAPLTMERGHVWQVPHDLDIAAMQAGADHLVGRHDFTTFRSVHCQSNSPVKTLDRLDVREVQTPAGSEIHFDVRARSFLHNQVRSFVGTLERVGAGAWTPDNVAYALKARERASCGPVSPPQGLYLVGVGYPQDPFGQNT